MSTSRVVPVVGGRSAPAGRWSDRARPAATALVVATLGVAPVALLPASSPIYVGLATASPTLYTYSVAIGAAAIVQAVLAPRTVLRGVLPWAPLVAWLAGATLLVWEPEPRLWSGLVHLALAAAAFAVGVAAAAPHRHGEPSPTAEPVPWLLAAVAWIQVVAAGLALVGLPLRTLERALALDVDGRATGLTTHPGELSKLLFFCAMCALILPQRTRWERRLAWSTLAVILVGVYLTQSRTVLAGLVVMVAVFVGLERATGRWQRRHVVVLGLTALLALASTPWIVQRFATDTGARGHTLRVALATIGQRPVGGVGPNGYVAVVGQTDRLTATGVPVHNVFLLSAAELGIAGALLLCLPFVLVAVRALRRARSTDPAARVIVAALPGVVAMAMTGWGLLQGPYFLTFAFLFGYFGARVGGADGDR